MCVNTHDLWPALGTTNHLDIAVSKDTDVQAAFQILYAYTSVSDAPNARVNQAHQKIYPESYSDAGTNVHTKQTIAENNLPYYLPDQVNTWV